MTYDNSLARVVSQTVEPVVTALVEQQERLVAQVIKLVAQVDQLDAAAREVSIAKRRDERAFSHLTGGAR